MAKAASSGLHIAVVIAAYNEAKMIGTVVKGVPRHIAGLGSLDVVVIDDGSSDETYRQAKREGAICLRHPINRGQGAALKTGFEYALATDYDVVVTYDADGQHSASEIERLIRALIDQKVDIVLGSRFLGTAINITNARKIVLKLGVFFTRIVSRVKVTDTHNGFRAITASALKRIQLYQDRMEHASEIIDQISRQKLRYAEVPVTITYNDYSKQKGQRNSNALRIAGKMIVHKIVK